jgi:DNA-binding NarL/FixJ family response regulator
MTQTKRARILLADDHSLVAAGLCKLLEEEFDLLGSVGDGRALLAAAKRERPDIILLDISMPLLNGVEAARQLQIAVPNAKLIFVTVHSDSPYVVEAFRAGASGYVLKRSAASELVAAIHEVLNGNLYVTPLIAKSAVEGILKVAEKRGPLLSTRQREVLQLVAEGHSAKEIADILRISPKTVEFHKAWIMKKLDLHSTAELTRYALEHRIANNLSG